MTTTCQQIFESGLARSTANDAGKLSVDGEMIPHINRKYQSLCARMALAGGDNWTAKTTGTFASSPPAFTLPTNPIDIVRMETSSGGRTYLVPIRDKDRTWVASPAAYRLGDSIVSLARAGMSPADPVATDTWTVYYKDVPATLTALGTALDSRFPVRFEMALILDVALYMSIKDENRDPTRIAALQKELDTENAMIEAIIAGSDSASSSPHPVQGTASQGPSK